MVEWVKDFRLRQYTAHSLVALLLALSVVNAYAQDTLERQHQGNITWMSGGIGSDEVEILQEARADFNLRLLFAVQGTRDYLADVGIRLQDSHGQPVFSANSRGPRMLLQVPPGSYKLTAAYRGKDISRDVTVPVTGAAPEQAFFWPENPG